MKRFFAAVLLLAMMFSLAACGKRHSLPDELVQNPVSAASPVPTAIPAPTTAPTPVPTTAPTPVPVVPVQPTVAPIHQQTAQTQQSSPAQHPVTVQPTSAPAQQQYTPVQQVQPQVTTVPVQPTTSPYLKITKSPTGEVVDEGGKAYFVARADNYSGITWFIANSNGTIVYQDAAASTMFPGLQIYGLGTETLCLENIPYDLSGWKVYAQFSGLGGPASTAYAYITVNKVSETYDSLLNKYRQVVNGQDGSQYGFSYLCNMDRNLGYMMQDIDGNGVYELLVGSLYGDGMLFEGYTLSNGVPVMIFQSTERDRYYLSNRASFYRHGSSGASNSEDTLYNYNGLNLSPIECVWCDDTYSQSDPEFFHCYGDRYSGNAEQIDSETYRQLTDQMAYSTVNPSFVQIR